MISERDDEDVGPSSFLAHIPAIVGQRRLFLVIPTIVLFIAGVIAAFLLPTSYRSSSILLVESAQMQVGTAEEKSNEAIDQRVAKVRQQVLSRPDLIEMIQRLDLYTNERASKPLSEVIEKLRDSVTFQPVGAEFSGGGGKSSTIAFSVSVDYPDPVKAQAVAQDIVDRILRIDSTKTAEQAQDAVQFLTDQAANLETQASLLESQISGIKARNGPAISNSSMAMFGGNSGNYDGQIAALMRENSQLNSQRDLTKTAANRDPVVASAELQLASARAVYAESHPDVVLARQRLAEAKELAAKNVGNIPIDPITSQLEFNNSQIAALRAAKARDSAQTSAILNAQARGPVVMDQIAQLQQKLDGLNAQYQQVANKLMQAQATAKMKNEQKGERLTVIDPPVVPDKPDWPNRPLFIGGGALAGLGLGIVLMFGIELILRPIRGLDTVKAITGSAPLAAIPTIVSRRTISDPWYRKLWPFKQRKDMALEN